MFRSGIISLTLLKVSSATRTKQKWARQREPASMEKPPGRLDRPACRFVLSHAGGNSSA
jgi:hypothetical protein